MKFQKMRRASVLLTVMLLLFSFVPATYADEDLGTWVNKVNIPTARSNALAAVIGNDIYLFGGATPTTNDSLVLEKYNTLTNTWETKENMPSSITGYKAATVEGKVYFVGGNSSSYQVKAYDPLTDSWETKGSIKTPRFLPAAAIVNNKIYVFGGFSNPVVKNTVEEYDPATDTWTTKTNMPTARYSFEAAVVNNKIYAIGGTNGTPLNTVEEYDPATDTWTTKADLPSAQANSGVVSLNNKIYVIGGGNTVSGNTTYLNTVYEYNTTDNSWVTLSNMSIPRAGAATASVSGVIYALGGVNDTGRLNANDMFTRFSTPANPAELTATGGNAQVTLTWTTVTDATSYNIKRATTAGGPYTQIGTSTTNSYTDTIVTNGTTYHYVVTAVTTGGESANSNEASATPSVPATAGNALLVITMTNGLEKEYDLTMTEINAFISWYDGKVAGTGTNYYIISKNFNLGPFQTRKDYIVFDKIMIFEVMQYQQSQ